MRHGYSTITPAVIHQQARDALRRVLDWQPYHKSVTVVELLSLLLLMASRGRSLFATVTRLFAFSHETASRAIKAQLPSLEQLTDNLVGALQDVPLFTKSDLRRSWQLAIDTHNVCYYGQHNKHLIGGPKKQGTKWFFGYATAVLVHKHSRYTVGLCAVLPGHQMHEIVRTLLDQVARKGLKIRGVALDSGFDSGETILLLQERRLAYVVPLRRKGRGSNARNRCFEGRDKQIRWTEWHTDRTRRLVRTRVLLWKGGRRTMAFAFDRCSGDRASSLYQTALRQRQHYKRRFGIETSYRQKNQAKATTTSKDPVYRLLLEGVAYLLRQVWVALTHELARSRHARPQDWIGALTVQLMLEWLDDELAQHYPEDRSIPLAP
jgi:hypothetical protein